MHIMQTPVGGVVSAKAGVVLAVGEEFLLVELDAGDFPSLDGGDVCG
jgi:hypothetical protein